ncbi:Imm72 family immunity protein [Niveibacterium sp. 24ML]|uniref:Imm72 family immunity protein n=1 Tax=Niveibacterium sp. 24ML TaxID=2985512 RepID=UPI0022715791|nr:Imm72 family immunity protein [Niveibacterium sp. 24ML]MCX9158026.1 Imm72 family immunity protein [Niveibacterium sp. 24ML]
MAYAIPTEQERPVLFRWLKQQSAYTTYAKIEPYFADWIAECKRIQPLALDPLDGQPALNDSEMRLLLTGYSAFVQALAKLRKGDRSAFKWMGYGTGQGYFCEAMRAVEAWQTSIARIAEGLPLADTEYWPGFEVRFKRLIRATCNGGAAWQARHLDVPAPLNDMRWFRGEIEPEVGSDFRELRDSGLNFPPVPTPDKETLVKTGDTIPCYGIWEPVKVKFSGGLVGLFKKPEVPEDGQFELDGCMNYLHAGSPAPTIGFEEDGYRMEGRPTVWRLLWEDTRYLDGTIPDEEREYLFARPEDRETVASDPVQTRVQSDLLVAHSGDLAEKAGVWALRDRLDVRVTLKQGERLPEYEGRPCDWVLVTH